MKIFAVKTAVIHPPKDDLLKAIACIIPSLKEKSVVVITSKVVSIWQGRCVPMDMDTYMNKEALVMREADLYLPREITPSALEKTIFIVRYSHARRHVLSVFVGDEVEEGTGRETAFI